MWQTQARRWTAGNCRQRIQNLLQGHVAPAQNISLADASFLGGQQMPRRDVFHRRDIQASIHIRWHLAFQEIQDDATCRGRLPIPRPYRRGGIYDNDWQAGGNSFYGNLLGQKLRTLIVPYHFIERSAGVFIWSRG